MNKKTILGLDLGTSSIGWALVREDLSHFGNGEIIKLGVRVNPLSADEKSDFEKGRPLSLNADRTAMRSARRNLQRYKLRRQHLISVLKANRLIKKDTVLCETGKNTTHETLFLRAKAANERIDKESLARVLLTINKKRGYKSSRKIRDNKEGQLIDGMTIAKWLHNHNLTPGQFVSQLLQGKNRYIPDFYRSDLEAEFAKIWHTQQLHYPDILTDDLFTNLKDKTRKQTWSICREPFQISGIQIKGKSDEQKLKRYGWRSDAVNTIIGLEELAIVFQDINGDLIKSDSYLGRLSDRSKVLYFNQKTVGEYLYEQIRTNPHTNLKNQIFYRQDYLDEFERIWEVQSKFHPELTPELKVEIRDVIIFYQRKLKSQKHLISNCEFEKFHKVAPKSSPVFQEFKIWQAINNLEFINKTTLEKSFPDLEFKNMLFEILNIKGDLKSNDLLKLAGYNKTKWDVNLKNGLQGNRLNIALYKVYTQIAEYEGYNIDWDISSPQVVKMELANVFATIGIRPEILEFCSEKPDFDKQMSYELWHLLYSAEEDEKSCLEDQMIYGKSHINLKKKLHIKYGFKPEYTALMANITFQPDYGSLSTRAIRKITPFLKAGHTYSEACLLAGYNHSGLLTKAEQETRPLKPRLELLKRHSLRNPVVEKILNQMVNLVNEIIETYGKPDEIRIELARELKKSAKERAAMTKAIQLSQSNNEKLRLLLQKDFNILNPSKNDITRYKLYEELRKIEYHSLLTNTYIPKEKLFSKDVDIEHIIPKALLFDDSFANKTLAYRKINLAKSNRTACDFITEDYHSEIEDYKQRIECLMKHKAISRAKYNKLLMSKTDLPENFIERDLRNSQYIAKKAKELLEGVVRTVSTTSGKITDTLRQDWDLIDVMKELNLPKYRKLGLTILEERRHGQIIEKIQNWTKRNDHRHHAMDALTVAFTSNSHVQYLNSLNASLQKNNSDLHSLRSKITTCYVLKNGASIRKFIPPTSNFREISKQHLESIFISFKSKNKVVTKNKNRTKTASKNQVTERIQLTPRGRLHKESVYGKIKTEVIKLEKVNGRFDREKVDHVTNPTVKQALLNRLAAFDNDPKKAFSGKNALVNSPVYLNESRTKCVAEYVKVKSYETYYTIKKPISPELKLDKIIDKRIKKVLEERLKQYDGDKKAAFSDLSKNPVWLNKPKGISIKRVTIKGIAKAEPLRTKKNHIGETIYGPDLLPQQTDFVSTGNNHHVAIYKDQKGILHEKLVSFYQAVAAVNIGKPVIDNTFNKDKGWTFLFTLKQNEMFVFPSANFDPNQIDLLDARNASVISKHLYRVQKVTSKDYFFRHHLETTVSDDTALKETTFKRLGPKGLARVIKIRLNHLGEIVHIGEY